MTQTTASSPGFGRFKTVRRKAVTVSQGSLVAMRPLFEGRRLPLLVRPRAERLDLASWADGNRELVDRKLHEHASLLFRGFDVGSVEAFEAAVAAMTGEILSYKERAAPRREMGRKVYTSTEFPADQWIPQHHEMSYSHNWPRRLFFYCARPPAAGGRTPLTDDRELLRRLDPDLTRPFLERKVMYVRNYGDGVDLPWQEVFQTEDRVEVERYCEAAGMEVEWRRGDRLRTRAVRQVLATHPVTGDTVWFNHAHMFHISNLDPAVRAALLEEFAPDELPRNAFYGDGSPIPAEALETIRRLYRESSVAFAWERGDVLLVDNVLASHGREPFEGPRQILVAMGDLHRSPAGERGVDAAVGQ